VLAPLGAAASLVVIFVAVLSIPLRTASDLGLSADETARWIAALYGLPSLLTVLLVRRYRQPLLITGNVFVLIFVASLGRDFAWPELVGASILAGAIVLTLGLLGLTERLAAWLPAPIVFGLLAGAVLHFFVDLFDAVGDEPLIVGGTLVLYVLSRRLLEPRVPALLPALIGGVGLAAFVGDLGAVPSSLSLPAAGLTTPDLTVEAAVTVAPVIVVLITLQANIPSSVFLREQAYQPPDRVLSAVSGAGSAAGSLLGPVGVSLSLPATALCAGPDAGEHGIRHWSAYIAGVAGIVIALLAGAATEILTAIPTALLAALVGLAVIGILATSLQAVTRGPLVLGPLFAFAIPQSQLELGGLGPFFWALVGGLAVSFVLEREQLRHLRVVEPRRTSTTQPVANPGAVQGNDQT
jgi:benzoate membrane transport protein